jgi:hypothetical protein
MNCNKCKRKYNTFDIKPQIIVPCCHIFCIKCLDRSKLCPHCGSLIHKSTTSQDLINIIQLLYISDNNKKDKTTASTQTDSIIQENHSSSIPSPPPLPPPLNLPPSPPFSPYLQSTPTLQQFSSRITNKPPLPPPTPSTPPPPPPPPLLPFTRYSLPNITKLKISSNCRNKDDYDENDNNKINKNKITNEKNKNETSLIMDDIPSPSKPLKNLNWQKLPPNSNINNNKSLWTNVNRKGSDIKIDYAKLEQLFSKECREFKKPPLASRLNENSNNNSISDNTDVCINKKKYKNFIYKN